MEWADLILDFAARIAWPVAFTAAVLAFRKPIGDFIRQLDEVSYNGASARRTTGQELLATLTEVTMPAPETPTDPTDVEHDITDSASPAHRRHVARYQIFESLNFPQRIDRARERLAAGGIPWAIQEAGDGLIQACREVAVYAHGRPVGHAQDPGIMLAAAGLPTDLSSRVSELYQFRLDAVGGFIDPDAQTAETFIDEVENTFCALLRAADLDREGETWTKLDYIP